MTPTLTSIADTAAVQVLPSDADLVAAAAATYASGATPIIANEVDRVFLTQIGEFSVFSIEGTYNLPGWLGDFLALGVREHPTKNHPTLGFLHLDFYESALRILPPMVAAAKAGPTVIGGHSRGAGLALLTGALLIDQGLRPAKLAAFAPPRVGGAQFVKVACSVPFSAYKFGDDPVPEVPFTLDPLFPYRQVPLTKIGAPLPGLHALDCHHIANYVAGVKAYLTKEAAS
jgi:hypothetical protein